MGWGLVGLRWMGPSVGRIHLIRSPVSKLFRPLFNFVLTSIRKIGPRYVERRGAAEG